MKKAELISTLAEIKIRLKRAQESADRVLK